MRETESIEQCIQKANIREALKLFQGQLQKFPQKDISNRLSLLSYRFSTYLLQKEAKESSFELLEQTRNGIVKDLIDILDDYKSILKSIINHPDLKSEQAGPYWKKHFKTLISEMTFDRFVSKENLELFRMKYDLVLETKFEGIGDVILSIYYSHSAISNWYLKRIIELSLEGLSFYNQYGKDNSFGRIVILSPQRALFNPGEKFRPSFYATGTKSLIEMANNDLINSRLKVVSICVEELHLISPYEMELKLGLNNHDWE